MKKAFEKRVLAFGVAFVIATLAGMVFLASQKASAQAGCVISNPLPAYAISSVFCARVHPITGVLRPHRGIDIAAPCGTEIRKPSGATMTCSSMSGYGNVVIFDYGNGIQEFHGHLESCNASTGVARVGSTGLSTGCHSHYEIRVNGQQVDPVSAWGMNLCDSDIKSCLTSDASRKLSGNGCGERADCGEPIEDDDSGDDDSGDDDSGDDDSGDNGYDDAPGSTGGGACCSCVCSTCVPLLHEMLRQHLSQEFKSHRNWMVNDYFLGHILRAWMMMAEQLTTVGMQQVEIIGTFFDAKHQLETQRLFQQLQARAHKDYHPSEMLCTLGTNIRAMSASERRSEFVTRSMAEHSISRQLLTGNRSSGRGLPGDIQDRLAQFKSTYCDPDDNGRGLGAICGGGPADRVNRDIDYTRLVDDAVTLEIDFSDDAVSNDEEDVIALQNYLFAHKVFSTMQQTYMDRLANQELYLDVRSIIAKRSVLENAYNQQVGLRAMGSGGNDAFLRAVLVEFGADPGEIDRHKEFISYYAQLRALVKAVQNPQFLTKLYDTPANVARLGVALQALKLQIDYQNLRSNWRQEMILAVDAELALMVAQEEVQNELGKIRARSPAGDAVTGAPAP